MALIDYTPSQKNAIKSETNTAKRINLMILYVISNARNALQDLINNTNNKLDTIDLTAKEDGTITFTDANGNDKTLGLTNSDRFQLYNSKLTSINPNPSFFLNDFDYTNYINQDPDNRYVTQTVSKETKGSLEVKGNGGILTTDTFIPVDLLKKYRMYLLSKSKHSDSAIDSTHNVKLFGGFYCYSPDKVLIKSEHVTKIQDTQAVVVNDISANDTVITIEGDINAYKNNTDIDKRRLLFHPLQDNGKYAFIDDSDFQHTELGYSRLISDAEYDNDNVVDIGNNQFTITLDTPIGLNITAGTKVRLSKVLDSLKYLLLNKDLPIDDEWHEILSLWKNISFNSDLTYNTKLFYDGTSYIKMVLLPNYLIVDNDGNIVQDKFDGLVTNYATISIEWEHEK